MTIKLKTGSASVAIALVMSSIFTSQGWAGITEDMLAAVSTTGTGGFSVRSVQSVDQSDTQSLPVGYKQDYSALQSAIAGNPELQSALQKKGVQIMNVIAAKKAANGNVIFYQK